MNNNLGLLKAMEEDGETSHAAVFVRPFQLPQLTKSIKLYNMASERFSVNNVCFFIFKAMGSTRGSQLRQHKGDGEETPSNVVIVCYS